MRYINLHTEVEKTLAALAADGRFPHALLLEGPEGAGKFSLALYAAAAVLCAEKGRPPEPGCSEFLKVFEGNHPDVSVYTGEGKSMNFAVDTVRKMRTDCAVLPNQAEKSIYILKDTHNMLAPAQNALLKILEEPPAHAIFILTSRAAGAMLPTVLSRVRTLAVPPLGSRQILFALSLLPGESGDENARKAAAAGAGGSLTRAIKIASGEYTSPDEHARKLLAYAVDGNFPALITLLASYERDREEADVLFLAVKTLAADELIARAAGKPGSFSSALSPLRAARIVDIMEEARRALVFNANMTLLCTAAGSEIIDIFAGENNRPRTFECK